MHHGDWCPSLNREVYYTCENKRCAQYQVPLQIPNTPVQLADPEVVARVQAQERNRGS